MSPRLLLALWRERWGKAAATAMQVPYLRGKLNAWGQRLTRAPAWSVPGVTAAVAGVCLVFFVFILSIDFSLGGQVFFSACFISAAVYLRRYAGTLITLVLMGMSVIVSTRYLLWRFSDTLGHDFSLSFVLGFGLGVAELYLCLQVALGFVQALWPLKRGAVPLPPSSAEWPTVDVFLPVQGHPQDAIRRAAVAALALDWPPKKIKIHLVDGEARADVATLAESLDVAYRVHPADSPLGAVNAALSATQGSLIVLLDPDQPPAASFLRQAVGWFVADAQLGMLQTPTSPLAPPASAPDLALCPSPPSGGACALLRRSMLAAVDGFELAPLSTQAHTALKFQAQGHGNAWVGAASAHEPELFRVDHPYLGASLRWKQRLTDLQTVLQFYNPVVRLVFFTAPLAYLLAGLQILQTNSELLLAYAVPHLLQAHVAQARLEGKHRFTAWADVREALLAWYLLLPTTGSLLRTEFSQLKHRLQARQPAQNAPFPWPRVLPFLIVVVLNLAGLGFGVARLLSTGTLGQSMTLLYLGWTVVNLTLLAAMLAVAQESRHIRQHTALHRHLPVMIRLPSGRTLSCVSDNFPDTLLAITLPTPVTLEVGAALNVSIFRDYREYMFEAEVSDLHASLLRVRIAQSAQNDYALFGVAVLSRDKNWPRWLPGRDADQPLPPWASKILSAGFTQTLALTEKIGRVFTLLHPGSWIRKWKRRHDPT